MGHSISTPMPSARLKLSSVGHIAISTENDTNLSIVGVVMFMKGKMPPKTVTRLIQERIIPRFSRFSSLVNDQKEFTPLEAYDCSSHVYSIDVPDGMDNERGVQELISPLHNRRFPMTKPLWDVGVLYLKSSNRTALYWRIHHCIGDGASLGMLINTISDNHINKEIRDPNLIKRNVVSRWLSELMTLMLLFIGTFGVFLHWIRSAFRTTFKSGTPKELKPKTLSPENVVAWNNKVIPLVRAKELISHIEQTVHSEAHITLNDLMLSCFTHALYRYLKETYDTKATYLPMAIPVNLRPSPFIKQMGNKIGSLSFHVPFAIEDPVDRVLNVSRITSRAKKLPEPIVTYNLTKLFSKMPEKLTKMAFDVMSQQVYCAVSNVRGSPTALFFDQFELESITGLVPPPTGVAIGVGLGSYSEWLGCSVNCDKGVIPDPIKVVKYYQEEFARLEQTFFLHEKK